MDNDNNTQTKVVRYAGTEERPTIQQNEQDQPLFSSSVSFIYLTENTNLDICVAHNGANAVVVVSAACKFRFRYTGHPSDPRNVFPQDINKDSQGKILTAEKTKKNVSTLLTKMVNSLIATLTNVAYSVHLVYVLTPVTTFS